MISPGTDIFIKREEEINPLAGIPAPIWRSGGLLLGQIREMTGLDASTVQNWIKRGYASPPKKKKYTADQTARILIINALRGGLRLDLIVKLIEHINGRTVGRSDGAISDSELYDMFCRLSAKLQRDMYMPTERIKELILKLCGDIENPELQNRVAEVLLLMCVCHQAELIKKTVEDLIYTL